MAAELDERRANPRQRGGWSFKPYNSPVGGWGSAKSLAKSLTRERVIASALPTLMRQNKPDGFACVSCAWAKSAEPHRFEFCENAPRQRPGRSLLAGSETIPCQPHIA